MTLGPRTSAVVAQMSKRFPAVGEMPVADARRQLAAIPRPPGPDLHSVSDHAITIQDDRNVAVRIYRPSQQQSPVVVFFHGGGWVLGDLDLQDAVCRHIAVGADAVVVSVDYRLAPECRYPAAALDAVAMTDWVLDHGHELGINNERIALAGLSAGGNLAAAVAHTFAVRGDQRIAFQLLGYPVLAADFSTPSYLENGEGYFITRDHLRWFWDQYVPRLGERTNPVAAPLEAPDFAGLPPTYVITAEYDPLRDEGERYAARLRDAGGVAVCVRYAGMFHGFLDCATVLPEAAAALDAAVAAVRSALDSERATPPRLAIGTDNDGAGRSSSCARWTQR